LCAAHHFQNVNEEVAQFLAVVKSGCDIDQSLGQSLTQTDRQTYRHTDIDTQRQTERERE